MLVIHYENLNTCRGKLQGCGYARRAAPDYQDIGIDGAYRLEPGGGIVEFRKIGHTIAGGNMHAFSDRYHTSLDGNAVDYHQTLSTLSVRTEYPLGAPVLGVVAEDLYAMSEKGRGDNFTLSGSKLLAMEIERDPGLPAHLYYRMGFDSVHTRPTFRQAMTYPTGGGESTGLVITSMVSISSG
jgi:hypothetical protein